MLQFCLHVLFYDLWFYASHRLLHTSLGWHIHKVHHEKTHPKWQDTYYEHGLEGPFQSIGFFVPFAFGFWNLWSMLAALALLNIRGMLRHDIRGIYWIGNHHLLHHRYPQYNFGEFWLDKLMGTDHPIEEECQAGILYH